MDHILQLKREKRQFLGDYACPGNARGLAQIALTLLPILALWYCVAAFPAAPAWVTVAITGALALFLLRAFVLMHDCGHGSLHRNQGLNRVFGYLLGVVSGMPQWVWSRHHDFHHATNGNWEKYRGPLVTASVEEFEAMGEAGRRRYCRARSLWMAPLAGFLYVLWFPRMNWVYGCAGLLVHAVRSFVRNPAARPATHFAGYQTRFWKSREEFRHMSANNLALLGIWAAACSVMDPVLFFSVYVASTSIAGGAGIVLFTVQHNFEGSYASATEGWDYDEAAIRGSSFLQLPAWLGWFTASIAFHHVHHLSARIPNYLLSKCHAEHAELFTEVRRIRLHEIPRHLRCILWDRQARKIITVAQWSAARSAAAATPAAA